jgi:CubicO group peptidase (beta-lactamase class C family)/WD40 repeat protein
MSRSCSDNALLQKLAEADLASGEWEQLARHLEGCEPCFSALGTMPVACARLESRLRGDGALRSTLTPLLERLRQRGADLTDASETPRAGPESENTPTPTLRFPNNYQTPWKEKDTQIAPDAALPAAVPAEGVDPRFDFLAPPQAPGELGRLGDFRVLRLLGQGGMGIVFQAEDTVLGRPAALKVMKPDLARVPEARQRFMREARAMASVDDAHVVTIFKVGEFGSIPFLAMELLQGQNLEKWLESGARPTVAEIVHLGIEVALGLEAAHRRGLIHRDIKPANLWLELRGSQAIGFAPVKILDFGLARPMQESSPLTHSGLMVGTPAYMAPEQADGGAVDTRSDLFSLGCVLYRLCTGQLPFGGATVMAVLKSVAVKEPTAPFEINRAVPKTLSKLILRLLAKEPADRPASAGEVAETLRAVELELTNEDTLLALPRGAPAPARTGKRRRWPRVVAALALLALAGYGLFRWFTYSDTRGIVELQSERPGVHVLIRQDRALKAVLDLERQPTARLAAGEYQIRIQENDPSLKLETDSIHVTAGTPLVIHVRVQKVEPPKVVIKPPDPPKKTPTPQEELATIGFLRGKQAVVHGVSLERFQRWLALLKETGHRPTWVNGFAGEREPNFAAVAVKDDAKTPWTAFFETGQDGYQKRFNTENARGQWPTTLSGYTSGKVHGFISVWQAAPPTLRYCAHALDPTNLVAANTPWSKDGLQPVNVSSYPIDNGHLLTALYAPCPGAGWTVLTGLPPDTVEEHFARWRNKGYRPISLHVSGAPAVPRVGAVLVRDDPQIYWLVRVNLSSKDLEQQLAYWAERGYEARNVVGYPAPGGTRFAAVWNRTPTFEIPTTGTPVPELESFDQVITGLMQERKAPGATLAVLKNGKLVLARGYGFADRSHTMTVEPNIPFRVSGLSTSFTAAGIQKLIRDGSLKMSTRVTEVLDIQPPPGRQRDSRWDKITIQHLLNHQGGWDVNASFDPMVRSQEVSAALGKTGAASSNDIIRFMAGQPLQFEPGSKKAYSNFGYCLLGRVVEKISGRSYIDYLRANLVPLAITSVEVGRTLPALRHSAEPFYDDPRTGKNVVDPKAMPTVPAPDGTFYLEAMDSHDGLIASAPDVARFLHICRFDGQPGVPENGATYGSLPGTFSIAIKRADGLVVVGLFNRRIADSHAGFVAILNLFNKAVDEVKSWPHEEIQLVPIVTPSATLHGHTDKVYNVVYSRDGKWLATTSEDRTIRLWEAASGKAGPVIPDNKEVPFAVTFLADSKQLVWATRTQGDGQVQFWDLVAGKAGKTLTASPNGIFDLQVSPDGRLLVCGGWDKTVRIFDLDTPGKPKILAQPDQNLVRAVSFAPDGQRLVAVGDHLSIWNLRTGQMEHTVRGKPMSGVQVSSHGDLIATAFWREGEIHLFDGACHPLGHWKAQPGFINDIGFSPDGRILASIGSGKTWLWDAAERRPLAVLFGHRDDGTHVAFSPDGKTLATTGYGDHTLRLWDVSRFTTPR